MLQRHAAKERDSLGKLCELVHKFRHLPLGWKSAVDDEKGILIESVRFDEFAELIQAGTGGTFLAKHRISLALHTHYIRDLHEVIERIGSRLMYMFVAIERFSQTSHKRQRVPIQIDVRLLNQVIGVLGEVAEERACMIKASLSRESSTSLACMSLSHAPSAKASRSFCSPILMPSN